MTCIYIYIYLSALRLMPPTLENCNARHNVFLGAHRVAWSDDFVYGLCAHVGARVFVFHLMRVAGRICLHTCVCSFLLIDGRFPSWPCCMLACVRVRVRIYLHSNAPLGACVAVRRDVCDMPSGAQVHVERICSHVRVRVYPCAIMAHTCTQLFGMFIHGSILHCQKHVGGFGRSVQRLKFSSILGPILGPPLGKRIG